MSYSLSSDLPAILTEPFRIWTTTFCILYKLQLYIGTSTAQKWTDCMQSKILEGKADIDLSQRRIVEAGHGSRLSGSCAAAPTIARIAAAAPPGMSHTHIYTSKQAVTHTHKHTHTYIQASKQSHTRSHNQKVMWAHKHASIQIT